MNWVTLSSIRKVARQAYPCRPRQRLSSAAFEYVVGRNFGRRGGIVFCRRSRVSVKERGHHAFIACSASRLSMVVAIFVATFGKPNSASRRGISSIARSRCQSPVPRQGQVRGSYRGGRPSRAHSTGGAISEPAKMSKPSSNHSNLSLFRVYLSWRARLSSSFGRCATKAADVSTQRNRDLKEQICIQSHRALTRSH